MAIAFTDGVSEVVATPSQMNAMSATSVLTASQGGTGLSAISSGYITLGNGSTTLTQVPFSNRLVAYSTALALSASGDIALTMSGPDALGSYCVRRVTLGLPNTSALATVIVVATIRTAAGGGGSAITGAIVVTGLSATTAYLDQAVTLASAVTTSTQLYVNVTVAAGTAPTSSLYVYADSLSV